LLQGTAATGVVGALLPLSRVAAQNAATPTPAFVATSEARAVLTDAEYATLVAAIDRLIPSDDLGPGASESGVDVYITSALSTLASGSLPVIRGGLAALGDGFAGLAASDQDALLGQAEAGTLEGAPAGFFATLLELTRQGMFGDPVYGGNQNYAGWDLLQYPGIKLVWTVEDQAIDADVPLTHTSVAQYGGEGLR
jgi:gluconate 2-dehydrogenase gamma chain